MSKLDEPKLPNGPKSLKFSAMSLDNSRQKPMNSGWLLNNGLTLGKALVMMKTALFAIALLCAAPASAACYADYKAKTDNPLKLHYGVIELPDNACSTNAAKGAIGARIARDGWTLLTVISIFDASALDAKKESAGEYFLRY